MPTRFTPLPLLIAVALGSCAVGGGCGHTGGGTTAAAPAVEPKEAGPVTWVRFEGPGVPFAVNFPNGAPEKKDPFAGETNPARRKQEEAVARTELWARTAGGRTYSVRVEQIRGMIAQATPEEILQNSLAVDRMSRPNTHELDKKSGELKGAPYRQAAFRVGDEETHLVRFVLSNGTLFVLRVEGGADLGPADRAAGEFFDSLDPQPHHEPAPKAPPK